MAREFILRKYWHLKIKVHKRHSEAQLTIIMQHGKVELLRKNEAICSESSVINLTRQSMQRLANTF
jgi:hypothetical protein